MVFEEIATRQVFVLFIICISRNLGRYVFC